MFKHHKFLNQKAYDIPGKNIVINRAIQFFICASNAPPAVAVGGPIVSVIDVQLTPILTAPFSAYHFFLKNPRILNPRV